MKKCLPQLKSINRLLLIITSNYSADKSLNIAIMVMIKVSVAKRKANETADAVRFIQNGQKVEANKGRALT